MKTQGHTKGVKETNVILWARYLQGSVLLRQKRKKSADNLDDWSLKLWSQLMSHGKPNLYGLQHL